MRGLHDVYPRRERKILRERLSESQNHRCAYCSKDIRHDATIDHLRPASKKGLLTYWNCVAACNRCNQKRKCRDAIKYFNCIAMNLARCNTFRAKVGLAPV